MMQTRLSSLIEAVINVVIGFVVSLAITAVVLPAYGHQVTLSENVQITLMVNGPRAAITQLDLLENLQA